MDNAKDAIFEEFLSKLADSIDDTCIVTPTNVETNPNLVGIPLEILDVNNAQQTLVASSGNLEVSGPTRVDIAIDAVEIFYSESLIKKVLSGYFCRFLDPAIVRMYSGADDEFDPDADDFY